MGGAVVVTRDEGPGGELTRLLEDRGERVVHWPTIRVAPPRDPEPLEAAVAELRGFRWVVFTSPRAVAALLRTLGGRGWPGPRIAAVGDATARAVREAGWPEPLVPETQTGHALVGTLGREGLEPGTRVLFPASAVAHRAVPDGLEEAGAAVVQVEAYRTEPASLDRGACREALEDGEVSVVTFSSPSAVRYLGAALGDALAERARARLRAVAIGPTTGAEAEREGWDVVVAPTHSLEGLADRVAALARP